MGAECCVMVSLGLTRFYRVPWNIWSSMKELFGHKYMSEEELKPYQLKKSGPFVHILDGLEIEE